MATGSLSASQNPVPFGGSTDITVSFQTAPGGTFEVKLFQDGQEQATGQVVFEGEPTPAVVAGQSNTGWEIRATGGTLTSLGDNRFRLSA